MAEEAIDFVRTKRGIVCPNAGFRVQLATYSERFVGNRAKQAMTSGTWTRKPGGNLRPKISEGIAERIRRFRSGSASTASSSVVAQVAAQEVVTSGLSNARP